jgi:adenylate cyclase
MSENTTLPPITIDLNEFKLHIALKKRIELTLHFNSPSRRFYLSVIALVVNEMKRLGKITSIPLEGHHDLLALLNNTIGGSAGSSEEKSLLSRIYGKWQHALPNLEEAPLFTILGRKKGYEEGTGKSYHLTETERDSWANLFEYQGSHQNARLKFAVDKIGASLDDIVILYDGSQNAEAWERFISSLTGKEGEEQEPEPDHRVSEGPVSETAQVPAPPLGRKGAPWARRYLWVALVAAIVVLLGTIAVAIWGNLLKPAPVNVASIERMAFPLPDKPSIAVLPFANIGGDPEQEYFSDGMTDDLITDLSKISGLFVIARNSTFSYKGKPVKIRQVAEELGVQYVLEGSVRRAGEQLRINAQLVDATTGGHLWSERYDGSMKEIFALQDKITQRIVAALAVKLTPEQKSAVSEKGTDSQAAYDEFLKGMDHFNRNTREEHAKAEVCFKRALELDPKFARARAALAWVYWDRTRFWFLHPRPWTDNAWVEARLLARHQLREAMKEPTTGAYRLPGSMDLYMHRFDAAISNGEKALSLDPNNPVLHSGMSGILTHAGRPEEGLEHAKTAVRLDPQNADRYLYQFANAYFCMGKWEETVTVLEKWRALNPSAGGIWSIGIAAYALLGREEEARAAYEARRKAGRIGPVGVQLISWPTKDRRIAESHAEGLIKAGMPGSLSDYIHVYPEDRLTEQDFRAGAGGTVVSLNPDGSQWSAQRDKDGDKVIYRGPPGPLAEGTTWSGEDRGRIWWEGDGNCVQYEKLFWGMVFCEAAYRNPSGTPGRKNEIVVLGDLGMSFVSPMP